jgi:hypothetical protein
MEVPCQGNPTQPSSICADNPGRLEMKVRPVWPDQRDPDRGRDEKPCKEFYHAILSNP